MISFASILIAVLAAFHWVGAGYASFGRLLRSIRFRFASSATADEQAAPTHSVQPMGVRRFSLAGDCAALSLASAIGVRPLARLFYLDGSALHDYFQPRGFDRPRSLRCLDGQHDRLADSAAVGHVAGGTAITGAAGAAHSQAGQGASVVEVGDEGRFFRGEASPSVGLSGIPARRVNKSGITGVIDERPLRFFSRDQKSVC
jgi:hypothetical protein